MAKKGTNSEQFKLNRADIEKWGKNALIFLAPTLFVLISSTINAVPKDWKYGAVVLYLLNLLTDIIKRYLQG